MNPNCEDEHQKYVEGTEIRRLESIYHYVSNNHIDTYTLYNCSCDCCIFILCRVFVYCSCNCCNIILCRMFILCIVVVIIVHIFILCRVFVYCSCNCCNIILCRMFILCIVVVIIVFSFCVGCLCIAVVIVVI
jgi:hypothetical protein